MKTDLIEQLAQEAKQEGITLDVLLAQKAESIEYGVYKHMDRVAQAYLQLTNVMIQGLNYAETKTLLDEMRLAAHDLQKYVAETLNTKFEVLPSDIQDLSAKHPHSVDLLYLNVTQWVWRFSTMPPQPVASKKNYYVRELTALYFLARDLALALEATPVERYYRPNGGEDAI